jgi:glycosyltransferase involved in cell wall biosynthesis
MPFSDLRNSIPARSPDTQQLPTHNEMRPAGITRVVLLSGSGLCNNPRVLKEAGALSRSGYNVSVLGAWLEEETKTCDLPLLEQAPFRFIPVYDCTHAGVANFAKHTIRRARRKAASVLHGIVQLESRYQLGLFTDILFARARQLNAALFIAHSEVSLHVARRLKRAGAHVGVDMEDWFSEDLLPQARRGRPLRLLRELERELLLHCAYSACPSRAMSEALAAEYGCKPPTVVYNAFPLAEQAATDSLRKDRRDTSIGSIVWYSQTIGPGRGLEDLAAALVLLDRDIEVHLRGRIMPGIEEWIRRQIPQRHQPRVFFHPPVPNNELLSRVAEHDIGFAGEMNYCRNRELTVTNKLLHYLLGGLAVVASDTAGQREVATRARGAVSLYKSGNPRELARALTALLDSPERLNSAKHAALDAAQRTFCWDMHEPALLSAVAAALREQAVF